MLSSPPLNTREQLLRDVHDFVSETGMKETLLLTRAGCDRRTLQYLRQGRRITTDVHDNIVNFMAAERARRAKAAAESGGAAEDKPGTTPEEHSDGER